MTDAPRLRWERQDTGSAVAYVGGVTLGMVVRVTGAPGTPVQGLWAYTVDGVVVRWISKGRGHVRTEALARRAIRRAWAAWWKAAGL